MCGNDTDMRAGWYLFLSTSQAWGCSRSESAGGEEEICLSETSAVWLWLAKLGPWHSLPGKPQGTETLLLSSRFLYGSQHSCRRHLAEVKSCWACDVEDDLLIEALLFSHLHMNCSQRHMMHMPVSVWDMHCLPAVFEFVWCLGWQGLLANLWA